MGTSCDGNNLQVSARDFQIVKMQATAFTPDFSFSSKRLMSDLYSEWSEHFDGNPTILPDFSQQGIPPEIPQVILQNSINTWRCEIAPSRVNVFWLKPKDDAEIVNLNTFLTKSAQLLEEYSRIMQINIGRLAGIVTRIIEHPHPAICLARHFCKDNMCMEDGEVSPLNRPAGFELHAHKLFKLPNDLEVNSWIRHKTGKLNGDNSSVPIIIVEQDINTLSESINTSSFDKKQIADFFRHVIIEFDKVLRLYYPIVKG